jgi:hypothetical protein
LPLLLGLILDSSLSAWPINSSSSISEAISQRAAGVLELLMIYVNAIVFVVGLFMLLLGGVALFFAWQKEQQAIVKANRAELLSKDAAKRTEALVVVVNEIREITGMVYAKSRVTASDSVYLDEERPEAEQFVLATIYKLGGRCAYRDVYDELRAYNAAVVAAGEKKLRLSEHRIREIINEYTFCSENAWPSILIKRKTGKTRAKWSDETIDYCVIVPISTRGGYSKMMISFDELARRASGKAAKNNAANGAVSAANGAISAANDGF